MNHDLQGVGTAAPLQSAIDAVVGRAEAQAKELAAFAKMIQAGLMSIENLSASKQAAVREHLASRPVGMSPRQFHAKQHAELSKFFRELKASGFKVYRASQQDHDYLFSNILDTVHAGVKPLVKPLLRAYAEQQGYEPAWAERIAAKSQPKKMGKSLKAKQHHPVIKDLQAGRMFTQTHQSTLKHATYSGIAELMFSGSQSTREKQALRDKMAALEAKLAAVEKEADRANARLNLMDAGLDWQEQARSILAAEPGIAKRELARRVGKSEVAVRKYWAQLASHRSAYAPA